MRVWSRDIGRRFARECAMAGIAGTACVVGLAVGGDAGPAQAIGRLGLVLAASVAAASCATTAQAGVGRSRGAWRLLALAAGLWAIGQAVWAWREGLAGPPPRFPSVADAASLAAVPFAVAGLLRLPAAPQRLTGRLRTVLDGVIVATALLFVSWATVLGPSARTGPADWTDVVALAYPIGDVVIGTVAFLVVARSRRGLGVPVPAVVLLACGFAGIAVADICFGYLAVTGRNGAGHLLVTTGWLCGFVLLALAARYPRDDAGTPPPTEPEATAMTIAPALPYLAVVGPVAVSGHLLATGRALGGVLGWNLTVLLVAVVARQVLMLAENVGLTRHLEQRVRRRTAELAASEHRFRALVQNSSDVVAIIDPDGTIRYVSPSVLRVFGYAPDDLVGTPWPALLRRDDAAAFFDLVGEVSESPRASLTVELDLRHAEGRWCRAELTVTDLQQETAVGGIVVNTRDVSERKDLEQQLVHQAFHDALTRLANRALFQDRVEHALAQSDRHGRPLAVLFLDLDGFKAVNDSMGHAAGDVLLVQIADRLRGCVRTGDTVARLGGDEFGVLLDNVAGEDEAVDVAARIGAALEQPVVIDGRTMRARASIGIALSTGVESAQDLLRNADLAMYRAKSRGEGGYESYEPGLHASLVARLETEEDLRWAIERQELVLHYQPTVELATGRIVGVEALVRWHHPTRGLVDPTDFIGLAEETGLIVPIGTWVLQEACRQARSWQSDHPSEPPLSVNVNLSPRQLREPDLVDCVAEALRESALSPSSLVLEITESSIVEDNGSLLDTLAGLRAMGVRLAIDDFGTGYSALSYLHRFPVDVLKVDRSFVEHLGRFTERTELVRTIVNLGHSLNLLTVAEGIETPVQLAALAEMGCDLGQGYYLCRPVDALTLGGLLASRHAVGSGVRMLGSRAS